MKRIFDIHPIQSGILLKLLFKKEARFSQLNDTELSSDHFNFHLKKLLNIGLIEKTTNLKYQLSTTGKEFANRFDTDKGIIERQAKIGVLICCVNNINEEKEFLLQQRLKQPYYGFWGFITGKVRWGESIFKTAERELKEETGLKASFTLAGIKHKTDFDKNGILLEDKFFFVIKGTNVSGKLKKTFEGGINEWFSENKILKINDLFSDVDQTLKIAQGANITFSEVKFNVKSY